MSKLKEFLARKDIVISPQRYLIDALGAMAQGLFASLLIGTIIKTVGQQTGLALLVDLGGYATAMSGPAMACAIGWALHCPPLVLFSLTPWATRPMRWAAQAARWPCSSLPLWQQSWARR